MIRMPRSRKLVWSRGKPYLMVLSCLSCIVTTKRILPGRRRLRYGLSCQSVTSLTPSRTTVTGTAAGWLIMWWYMARSAPIESGM